MYQFFFFSNMDKYFDYIILDYFRPGRKRDVHD